MSRSFGDHATECKGPYRSIEAALFGNIVLLRQVELLFIDAVGVVDGSDLVSVMVSWTRALQDGPEPDDLDAETRR